MVKDKIQYSLLVVEDNPGDLALITDFLEEEIDKPRIIAASTYAQASKIIDTSEDFDVILLDLSLPDKNGRNLVDAMLIKADACCPVIILTGYADQSFSKKYIALGISDYLLKDELNATILYKSILYAIERFRVNKQLLDSERKYSDLFNLSPQPMWLYELETLKFSQVNNAAIKDYGFTEAEFMNMTIMDIRDSSEIKKTMQAVEASHRIFGKVYSGNFKHRIKGGDIIDVEIYSTAILINGRQCRSVIAVDVSERTRQELRMTKAIIKTQEDERYEVGGELHDNVCQILAATQMSLGIVRKSATPALAPMLQQSVDYIKMALEEIRNLSHRLAPAFFSNSNLKDSFLQLLDNLNADKKWQTALQFSDEVAALNLDRDFQLNMYRILQEQLNNVAKYANAKIVNVKVDIEDDCIVLSIMDDGVGFNADGVIGGIGIANMQRRTQLFAGSFKISSKPGSGCSVNISVPVENAIT